MLYDGATWKDVGVDSAWLVRTPTITSSTGATPTLGTGGTHRQRYQKTGKTCILQGQLTFGTGFTTPGGTFRTDIPFAGYSGANAIDQIGAATYFVAAGNPNITVGACRLNVGDSFLIFNVPSPTTTGDWNNMSNTTYPTAAPPAVNAFAAGDSFTYAIVYETA